MPELPEVETTLRGIAPYIDNQKITNVVVRNSSLRWPVPVKALQTLIGETGIRVERIAKYILIHTDKGCVLLHLGMSGSLRALSKDQAPEKEKRSAHWWIWGSIIALFIIERFLGMRTASS